MADLVVPALGESITEAVIARWLKNVGDNAAVDEPLVDLETDKITVQLPAPVAGVLAEQRFTAGQTVKVGDVIGRVDGKGASFDSAQDARGVAAAPAKKPQAAAPTPAEEQATGNRQQATGNRKVGSG